MKQKVNLTGEKLTYWRSVENRKRTEEYLLSIENEFKEGLTEISSMDRRSMLKVMGASVALAGMGVSCRRPEEKILPYVNQPEDTVMGIPKFYATAQPTPFGANGILVESHEGRPTKVEGNPTHPESLGKASLINQAAALEIYDPDRSRFCVKNDAGTRLPVEWVEWDKFFSDHFYGLRKNKGKGLALLFDTEMSPSALYLKRQVKAKYPAVKFYTHEPMRQKNTELAAKIAFGSNKRVSYHVENAKVLLTLFHDPFSFGPEHIRHIKGYGQNRQVYSAKEAHKMSRVYAVEADHSLAGINSDHRLRLPIGLSTNFIKALAYELHAIHGLDVPLSVGKRKSLSELIKRPPATKGIDKKFLRVMAKDLAKNKGNALIMGGDHLDAESLALIHVLNTCLLGHKKTFDVLDVDDKDVIAHFAQPDIFDLNKDLLAGKIDTLLMLGVNPVYNAPGKLNFSEALKKARVSIHLGQHDDETAHKSTWHLPQTHFLEHFSDTRAYDGHISIVQPLIKPLHNSRSTLQVLAQIAGLEWSETLPLVRTELYSNKEKVSKAIHDGVVANSSFKKSSSIAIDCGLVYVGFNKLEKRAPNKDNFELILNFDRKVLDGRYANHSWLQELPDPVTKIDWGNALLMSPKAAKELKIKSGVKKNAYVADVVKLSANGITLELPVFVMPGLSDYSLVSTLGYGRAKAGEVGNGVGVDLYPLVENFSELVYHGVNLQITGKTFRISSTQEQFAMNGDTVQEVDVLTMKGRDPARVTNVKDYVKDPLNAKTKGIPQNLLVKEENRNDKVPLQITKAWDYSKGNQWGMVIDLAKCTGCNACVVACQSENNIPVVGKEQVIRGRMMHWLRIDRYFTGDVSSPQAISQPVPCQHCENAPCEPVCPVAATSHDHEGLNAMTYNRCIGTRYCANNCPYKVRRFNYFDFTKSGNIHVDEKDRERQKTIKLQRNPEVTVRYRGVMEKCTYCTQRIKEAKMSARRNGKDHDNLPDGAVTPACAQTCPSEAITFGNINDNNSRISNLKKVDRNYTMLDILNARPRTSYLSKLRNPHPDLVA